MLTGYVTAQTGTSKRSAAGNIELQRKWYNTVTELIERVTKKAMVILGDEELVKMLLPWLIVNIDEECLNAMGKNAKLVGAQGKKKHDNQHGTSRLLPVVAALFFFSS